MYFFGATLGEPCAADSLMGRGQYEMVAGVFEAGLCARAFIGCAHHGDQRLQPSDDLQGPVIHNEAVCLLIRQQISWATSCM